MKKKEKMRVWLSKCSTVSVVLPVSLSLLLSCASLPFQCGKRLSEPLLLLACFFYFFFPSFASSLGLCCFSFPFPLDRLEKLLKKKRGKKKRRKSEKSGK